MHQYIRHKIIPAVNRPSRSRAQVRVRPVVSYGTVLPSSTVKAAKLRPAAMVKTACLLSVTKVETVREWTNLSKDLTDFRACREVTSGTEYRIRGLHVISFYRMRQAKLHVRCQCDRTCGLWSLRLVFNFHGAEATKPGQTLILSKIIFSTAVIGGRLGAE